MRRMERHKGLPQRQETELIRQQAPGKRAEDIDPVETHNEQDQAPVRHNIALPKQRSQDTGASLNTTRFIPGMMDRPYWKSPEADEIEEEPFMFPPVIWQVIIIAVMILGFLFMRAKHTTAVYILVAFISIVCMVAFFRLNRILLVRSVSILFGLIILISSITGVSEVRRENEAIRIEQEAAAAQQRQREADDRARRALLPPSREEIARGGKTHDGIYLKSVLYYQGTTRYHVNPNCTAVNESYRPMTAFILYEQLTERKYAAMQPCSTCSAPVRPHTH